MLNVTSKMSEAAYGGPCENCTLVYPSGDCLRCVSLGGPIDGKWGYITKIPTIGYVWPKIKEKR